MEINRTIKIFILILFLLCLNLSAQTQGGFTFPFYDRGIGGTAAGLGNAFVSIANDASACFYNPAGLADINKKMLNINYESSFVGNENLVYLAYVHNVSPTTGLGFSFIWDGIANLQSYDVNQNNTGSYGESVYQVSFSYGHKFTPDIDLGLTVKLFNYSIWNYTANDFDLDIGTKITIINNLKYGILLQNMLPLGFTLNTTSEKLPLNIQTGFNYTINKLLIIYEIEKQIVSPFNASSFVNHIGARYDFYNYLALNLGYDFNKFYIGINLYLENLSLFSGTIRAPDDVGNLNFGITYTFKEPKEKEGEASAEMEDFYQGIVAYQSKDYRTAIKYFKKVKDKGDNPTADYYLKNAQDYLDSEEWMSDEEKTLVGMKMDLAEKAIAKEEYGKAISTLRDVLNINPENEAASTLMAKTKDTVKEKVASLYTVSKVLFDQNKNKESLDKCIEGLSLDSEYKPLLELKKENEKILNIDSEKARIADQKKDEADSLYNAGLESFKNGNWTDAINDFQKSYEINSNPDAKNYIDKARKQLADAKLTEKQQKESDVHVKLGQDLYNKNKIGDAIKEFETAVNIYPGNATAQQSLSDARAKYDSMVNGPLEQGKNALRDGRLSEAINDFQTVLNIDPANEIAKTFLQKSQSLINDTVKLNLKQAQEEAANNNYAKALEYYREVIKLDANNNEAKKGADFCQSKIQGDIKGHMDKGIALFNTQKYKDATDEFQNALALDSEYLPAKDWLGKSQQLYEKNKVSITIGEDMQNGIDQFQNKNYAQAKTFFQKVLSNDTGNKDAKDYLKKCDIELAKLQKQEEIAKVITDGLIQYRRKKFNEAIEIWQKAKAMDPSNTAIEEYITSAGKAKEESLNKYYNDGIKYFEDNNLALAKENLERALQQNPNHSKAKAKLSEVNAAIFEQVNAAKNNGKDQFSKGNYDQAIESFNTVLKFEADNDEITDLKQESENIKTLLDDGSTLMSQQKYAEAIEKYDNVLKINKNDATAQSKMQQALLEGKKQTSVWYNDGLRYYSGGDLKKALVRFSSVVKTDPTHVEAQNMLQKVSTEIDDKVNNYYKTGLAFYEQGDYKDAIENFNKIIDLKGSFKDTSLLLTKANKIYAQKSEKENQLSEQKVESSLFEGIRLYRDGKLKEAIAEWEKILKVYPNNSKALKYINRAKYKLSQLEKI